MYSKGRDWLSVFYGEGLVECTLTMGRDWLSVLSLWGGIGRVYSHYGEGLVECILTMGGTGQVYSHYGEGLVERTLTMMRDWLNVLSLW